MKPDKNILIDYLYGEISDEKRLEIELYFSQNPAEKIHLEALKNTQNILHQLKDKTPKQPLILMNMDNLTTKSTKKTNKQNNQQNINTTQNQTQSQPFFNAFTRNFMGVAACLSFLFLSAYLTGFSVRQTDKGFEVAFGKNNQNDNQQLDKNQQQKPQLQLTDEQINKTASNSNQNNNDKNTQFMENFISQKMKEKDTYYENELSALKNKVSNQNSNAFLSSNASANAGNSKGTFTNKEVQEMLKKVREEDFEMMRGFVAANNIQQSEYINTAFKSFAEYWEGKRQQDLSAIGSSFSTFKDEAKEKFKENDMILTRLTAK